jgi:hypothetical protein
MLFKSQTTDEYRLWSAPRCAVVLGFTVVLFFLFVGICFSFIQVRPSVVLEIKKEQITGHFFNPQAIQVHGFMSIEFIRLIKKDGSSESIPYVSKDISGPSLFIMLPDSPPSHAAYAVCSQRNVWQFLWERWLLMWGTAT